MIFTTEHPILMPKSSGKPFGSLSMEEMLHLSSKLTEAEQAHPHARYYKEMPAPLPKEHLDAIAFGAIDPSKGFSMKDYGKFMNNTGHCDVENGYCILPDGVTYAAVLIRQEGRTDEMVDYYNKNFADFASLFYKIWHPNQHYFHYDDGCLEDFGFGRLNMKFAGPVDVEYLGINYEDIVKNDPACINISGCTTMGYVLDGENPELVERNTIVAYHRLTDYGRELRIRLWYGIGIQDGEYVYTPPKRERAMEIARKTMMHVMEEYTNDDYLERRFWEDAH